MYICTYIYNNYYYLDSGFSVTFLIIRVVFTSVHLPSGQVRTQSRLLAGVLMRRQARSTGPLQTLGVPPGVKMASSVSLVVLTSVVLKMKLLPVSLTSRMSIKGYERKKKEGGG